MSKKFLLVSSLALAFAAYSGQTVAQEKEAKCEGDPQAPMITLNLKTKKAKPECALAHLGTTIVFRIVPKKDLDRVAVLIEPKYALDLWLKGDNTSLRDAIVIKVPGVHTPQDLKDKHSVHDYNIIVDGVVIDPRIKVEY